MSLGSSHRQTADRRPDGPTFKSIDWFRIRQKTLCEQPSNWNKTFVQRTTQWSYESRMKTKPLRSTAKVAQVCSFHIVDTWVFSLWFCGIFPFCVCLRFLIHLKCPLGWGPPQPHWRTTGICRKSPVILFTKFKTNQLKPTCKCYFRLAITVFSVIEVCHNSNENCVTSRGKSKNQPHQQGDQMTRAMMYMMM